MKLFILAAGTGSRLMPLTKNTPKSLLDIGEGTTVLERQLNNAINSNLFDEIIILTGYKQEQIEAKIKDYNLKIKLSTIYNPFYETTNNLVSLWLAGFMLRNDDFMITNGDNIYKDHVYQSVQSNSPDIIQIAIDFKEHYDEDDMKVTLGSNKSVIKVHKEIGLDETHAESVGLALVKGEKSRRLFVDKMDSLIKVSDNLSRYWLVLFNSLVEDGITVHAKEISGGDWRELDFHPDIEALRKLVFKGF